MGDNDKVPVEEVKFIPADTPEKVKDPEKSGDPGAFVGLTKDDLLQYADDPFWVRTRRILFILFWVVWVGMVAAAVIIIVVSPKCPARPNQKWWETSAVYRVDVRTFQDSNGDGVGDLKGLKKRLDYVKKLGMGAVCLRPIFATGQKDELRRDVVDFKSVDGEIGNMADFKALVKTARKMGIRVLLEFLPNYSSKNHTFFQASQKKEKAYENFYVWSSGAPANNDWKTVDDPAVSAWTEDFVRKEHYYAVHGPELPDLNLRDPDVKTEIRDTMKYWLTQEGVDGFVVGEADYLVESENLAGNEEGWRLQADSAALVVEWRTMLDEVSSETGKDRALIVELEGGNATQRSLYYGSKENPGAHLVVNGRLIDALTTDCKDDKLTGECVKDVLEESMKIVQESFQKDGNEDRPWFNWAVSSLAKGRIGSIVGDEKLLDAFNLLLTTLPGTPFALYGDELGMKDSDEEKFKALAVMQWDNGEYAGFSDADTRFPVNKDSSEVNVKFQMAKGNDDSHLNAFQSFLRLRSENAFAYGDLKILTANSELLTFVREAKGHPAYYFAVNLGLRAALIPGPSFESEGIPDKCEIVATTSGTHPDFAKKTVFDPKVTNILLNKGDGVVVKLGRV